jgi:hypothetical protein
MLGVALPILEAEKAAFFKTSKTELVFIEKDMQRYPNISLHSSRHCILILPKRLSRSEVVKW